MSVVTDKLQARIDSLDTDIQRIADEAARQITELRGQKTQLAQMKAALVANPALESLMAQAKKLELL